MIKLKLFILLYIQDVFILILFSAKALRSSFAASKRFKLREFLEKVIKNVQFSAFLFNLFTSLRLILIIVFPKILNRMSYNLLFYRFFY